MHPRGYDLEYWHLGAIEAGRERCGVWGDGGATASAGSGNKINIKM